MSRLHYKGKQNNAFLISCNFLQNRKLSSLYHQIEAKIGKKHFPLSSVDCSNEETIMMMMMNLFGHLGLDFLYFTMCDGTVHD